MIDGADHIKQYAPKLRVAEILLDDPRISAHVVPGKIDQVSMHVNVVGGLLAVHVTVPPWSDKREKAEDRAKFAWGYLVHEIAHVVETNVTDLGRPNLGMFTFEELARLRVNPDWIDETSARPHMVTELRAQIIQARLLGDRLVDLDGYVDAALTVLGKLNRKTKNSEWRRTAEIRASVPEQAELLAELERKLVLVAASKPQ